MRSHQHRVRGFLCLGLMLGTLLVVGGAFVLEATHPPEVQDAFIALRIPLTLVAGGFLAGGAFASLRRTLVVSLILMEVCTVLGLVLYFLGLPALELLPFAAVTVAGQALLVLPKVLKD
jgi:hypothetical protein